MNKKLFNICRNIIAITLCIAMMLYFGYAHSSLAKTYADTGIENGEAAGTEQAENDSSEEGETENLDDNGSETDNFDNPDSDDNLDSDDNSEEQNLNVGGEENHYVDTTTVIATITYSYSTEVPDDSIEDDLNDNPENNLENDLDNNSLDENVDEELQAGASDDEAENIETVTLEFYTLGEAFNGTIQATETMASWGVTDYVPIIKIVEDFTLVYPEANERNASFVLDLNGHCITCGENTYIDFGEGNIAITDNSYVDNQSAIGRVVGDVPYLFAGMGNITFENGYFISNQGQIVNTTLSEESLISVRNGFYVFDILKGFSNEANIKFEGKKTFVETEKMINDVAITGFAVGIPNYQVAISVEPTEENGLLINKEIYLYYINFERAWERAVYLSKENNSALSSINILNKEVENVGIDRIYELSTDENQKSASIMLVNIDFKRINSFDGNMFSISGGKIIFDHCRLDGYINDESVSQGSVIRILRGGEVELKDSSVVNNRSVANGQTRDPGAGVYLESDAVLKLIGNVAIKNNTLYIPANIYENLYTINQNLYMAEGARLTLLGDVKGQVADIGITNEKGVIAGLTSLGQLEQSYFDQIADNLQEDILKVFSIDSYPSYFVSFDKGNNNLFWDKDVRYLPEAGAFRFEFVVLLIGLAGFILRNIPSVKKHKGIEVVVTVVAISCLFSGSVIGFISLQSEKEKSEENQQIIRELTAGQQRINSDVVAETSSEDVTSEVEERETVNNSLGVPNDGRDYYGIIVIEELGIRLPVLSEYTDANMKTTPCVYYGQAESSNLVIVGHNYDSQFGGFNNIQGDVKITLYLMDGSVYHYRSIEVEYLNPDQVDDMLLGRWDFTVFTCSYSGDKRIAVRCTEMQ